jgi:carbon storage regulator
MLILSRKPGETVVIDGNIRVKVVRVEGDVVKIGIEAPAEVSVHRQEVYDEIQRSNKEALTGGHSALPRLNKKKIKNLEPEVLKT